MSSPQDTRQDVLNAAPGGVCDSHGRHCHRRPHRLSGPSAKPLPDDGDAQVRRDRLQDHPALTGTTDGIVGVSAWSFGTVGHLGQKRGSRPELLSPADRYWCRPPAHLVQSRVAARSHPRPRNRRERHGINTARYKPGFVAAVPVARAVTHYTASSEPATAVAMSLAAWRPTNPGAAHRQFPPARFGSSTTRCSARCSLRDRSLAKGRSTAGPVRRFPDAGSRVEEQRWLLKSIPCAVRWRGWRWTVCSA